MKNFPKGTKPEDTRSVDVSIDIDVPLEDVWPYLSTSEGLSSWYVETDLEKPEPGAGCKLTFGPGMVVPAIVLGYEVHDHIRIGAPPEMESPRVEEYRIRAREGGCTVRVVNWGFGEGVDWDAEYDAVKKGWAIFLGVLKIIAENFHRFGAPERVQFVSMAPDAAAAWKSVEEALAAQDTPTSGGAITLTPDFADPVSGTVDFLGDLELGFLDRDDAGGILFRAMVEESGHGGAMIAVGFHLFGDRKANSERIESQWSGWFREAFPMPSA